MLKKIISLGPLFFISFLLTFSPTIASSTTIELGGYYRVLGDYLYGKGLSWSGEKPSRTSAFFYNRLRMEPALVISERASLMISADILDNVLWGFNRPTNGDGGTYPLFSETADNYGINMDEVDVLKVNNVWAEFITPVGKIKVGRMPVHWGLGLFFNDGSCPTCQFGDYADRISFLTRIGPVFVEPAYSKITEGPVETTKTGRLSGDVNGLTLKILYEDGNKKAGIYWDNRIQRSSDSYIWIVDGFGDWYIRPFRLEAEVLTIRGRSRIPKFFGKNYRLSLRRWGGVVRASTRISLFEPGMECGIASGPHTNEYDLTRHGQSKGNILAQLSFDPDYNPDMIMFRHLTSGYVLDPVGKESPGLASFDGGAVSNAWYIKPFTKLRYNDLIATLGITHAHCLKKYMGDRYMGTEVDIGAQLKTRHSIKIGMDLGILFAGDAVAHMLGSSPGTYFTGQGMFLIHF